ncbi:MAG: diacylglycerol kinase family lipid kinase [Pyrinomonadaceae bacterium]|nr:diacylglycerol kinase family lipid kinase [Pyrinomonadaceae bacterium]
MLEESIEVIINVGSGADDKKEMRKRLAEIFAAGNRKANISLARSGEEVVELSRRAARSNSRIVVAGGGDGTINAVASAVIDTDKTLGVLPFGTLNHFAKDLHIPLDLEAAARTIIAGHITQVDVGEVNHHIFLNNSSLGLYPRLVHEREKHQRLGLGKWAAFFWSTIAVLRRYPFLDVKLSVEGKDFSSRSPLVFIGNNEYEMESLNAGNRASLNAGRLSVYLTRETGRLGLVRLAWRALFGGLHDDKDFLALCSKEIWIETKHRRLRVARDGEVTVMQPPLHYRVRPLSLRVLVPVRTASGPGSPAGQPGWGGGSDRVNETK